MLFGVGASCRILYSIISYLYVRCSGSVTSVGEERELICRLSFTCNNVVSVRRGFLFLLVLGIGCVILLWYSLVLPYNYCDERFIYKYFICDPMGLHVPCPEDAKDIISKKVAIQLSLVK